MKLGIAIDTHIQRKRNDGASYTSQGIQLHSFGRYIGDVELGAITTTQILAFLNRHEISTYTWRVRHAQLTEFFRHAYLVGAMPQIDMPAPRGYVRQIFRPYVYSRPEIRVLLESASRIPRNANSLVHAETLRMLIVLLYGTGARLTEVIALRVGDVDIKERALYFRLQGTRHSRSIPIGPDLVRLLRCYSKWKKTMRIEGYLFLLRRDGQPLNRDAMHYGFRQLLATAGVARKDGTPDRPRLYDFRTTFAVHQIASWLRKGKELNRLLPALSAYLGHVDLNSTEQYLALTPERFKRELNKLSPLRGRKWSSDPELMRFVSGL